MGEYSMIQIVLKSALEIVIHPNEDIDSHDECKCKMVLFH